MATESIRRGRVYGVLLGALVLLAAPGCGKEFKRVPVSGTVTLDGQPLASGAKREFGMYVYQAYLPVPSQGEATVALYLPGSDTSGKHDSLVIPAAHFDSGRTFLIREPEGEFRIKLNRIIRKGADWINARFEIEAKKS